MKKDRKHRVPRIALIFAGILLALAVGLGGSIVMTQPVAPLPAKPFRLSGEPDPGATLTAEQAGADAAQMAAFLEEVHPLFLDGQPESYKKAKAEYLAAAGEGMSVSRFRSITSRFLTGLNDGHTHLYLTDPVVLDVEWNLRGGSLVVGNDPRLPENSTVTAIGGVPVSEVLSAVDGLCPAENDAARKANRERYAKSRTVLEDAGIHTSSWTKITVRTGEGEKTAAVPYRSAETGKSNLPFVEGREENGIFLVTLRSCELGPALDRTAAALKQAVADGVRRVVIDVRDNPGGSSDACLALLRAMGMEPGSYGGTVRFSGPAADQRGYVRRSGFLRFDPGSRSVPNPDVRLCVVTNEKTFSSATMLAVWVRDGHLGKVVGRPSGNKPSSYGDVILFQLANSRLYGSVSHKQWLRPDASRNDRPELVPDVTVPDGGDSLKAAADLLNG